MLPLPGCRDGSPEPASALVGFPAPPQVCGRQGGPGGGLLLLGDTQMAVWPFTGWGRAGTAEVRGGGKALEVTVLCGGSRLEIPGLCVDLGGEAYRDGELSVRGVGMTPLASLVLLEVRPPSWQPSPQAEDPAQPWSGYHFY